MSEVEELLEAVENAERATNRFVLAFVNLENARRRVGAYGVRYNHGRARKVSFRRPSPQMSRKCLDGLWTKEYLAEPIEWEGVSP